MSDQDANQDHNFKPADHWEVYLRAYAPLEATERQGLLERCVTDDVVFTNPGGAGRTRDSLIRHIEDFQAKLPGTTFSTERVYQHHGELLASWTMRKPDGTGVAKGYNFVQISNDGRFKYLAGFF